MDRALTGADFRRRLTRWYRHNARDLPWRRTRKEQVRDVDLKPGVLSIVAEGPVLKARLIVVGQGNARPDELVAALSGQAVPRTRVLRERLLMPDGTTAEIASVAGERAVLGA